MKSPTFFPPHLESSREAKTRNKRVTKSNEKLLVRTFDWLVPPISRNMPDVQLLTVCSYICVLCIKPLWLNLNPWLLYILNKSETSQHLQKFKIYQHIELLLSHEFLICIHQSRMGSLGPMIMALGKLVVLCIISCGQQNPLGKQLWVHFVLILLYSED